MARSISPEPRRNRVSSVGAVLCAALCFAAVFPGSTMAGEGDRRTSDTTQRPGIGASTADPVGQPFALPPGLVMKEPVDGFYENDCRRDDQGETDLEIGHGLNVPLCLQFTNTTQKPIEVHLPAGLIFVSFDDETQNGLLVVVETFEVPPGEDPYFVKLGLHCLNIGRSPGGLGDEFRIGPVTEDKALRLVLDQIAGHPLASDMADHIAVQNLVWNASDDIRLEPSDRAWIADLQNR